MPLSLKTVLRWIAPLTAVVILSTTVLVSQNLGETSATDSRAGKLIREGTKIESQPATCRYNGERLIVELDGMPPLLALENLAAQRVLEAVHVDPNDKTWVLDGSITEFRGNNFLYLKRVKRHSK